MQARDEDLRPYTSTAIQSLIKGLAFSHKGLRDVELRVQIRALSVKHDISPLGLLLTELTRPWAAPFPSNYEQVKIPCMGVHLQWPTNLCSSTRKAMPCNLSNWLLYIHVACSCVNKSSSVTFHEGQFLSQIPFH